MPNMQRKAQQRGHWLLDWASEKITYSAVVEASGWFIDLRDINSAADVLDIVTAAQQKVFVSAKDICSLCDLLRIFALERTR